MNTWITLAIVAVTYLGIALGGYPRLRTNRTTVTLIGVGLLLAVRQIDFAQIGPFLDLNTLVLLFGMMILNANLQLAGFFRWAGNFILEKAGNPRTFLGLVILITGVLSALFLNDTICLMLTPLILDLTLAARRNPVPYLIALATAANIGSVATLTGNPQNMIIGIASGISYADFALALTPIALLGLGCIWLVLVLMYPQEFRQSSFSKIDFPQPQVFRPLLLKSLLVTGGLLVAFLLNVPIALAAFLAACILLVTRRIKSEKIMVAIDTELLVFFGALFILSGAMEVSGLTERIFALTGTWLQGNVGSLSLVTVVLSNLISNVPAVLLLKPVIAQFADPRPAWLTLAAASTLAGNLTLLGSVANLIVAEVAGRRKVKLGFWEYTKAGIPITLISLFIGIVWIRVFLWQ